MEIKMYPKCCRMCKYYYTQVMYVPTLVERQAVNIVELEMCSRSNAETKNINKCNGYECSNVPYNRGEIE